MTWLFSPPSIDDLIRLLKAWRIWVLGAFIGAVLAAAVYVVAPPPYRARATVLVDFNLEGAWPQDTDRQQFYYLEREARKLEEIAWSDVVLEEVSGGRLALSMLREGKLQLSQPAEGGWHFYADDMDPQQAKELASGWAQAFAAEAARRIAASEGLDSHIEVAVTQTADLSVDRSLPLGAYLLAGALIAWFLSAFVFLFFDFGQPRAAQKTKQKAKTEDRRPRT